MFLVLNRATLLAGGLAAVMLLAAVLLITTTIRLSALSRRRETGIMARRRVHDLHPGAPFMLEGAIAATVGALLAVSGLWLGVEYLVTDWLRRVRRMDPVRQHRRRPRGRARAGRRRDPARGDLVARDPQPLHEGVTVARRRRLTAVLAALALVAGVAVASPALADPIDDRRKAAEQQAAANAKAQADAEAAMEVSTQRIQVTAARLLEAAGADPRGAGETDEAKAALEKARREAALIAERASSTPRSSRSPCPPRSRRTPTRPRGCAPRSARWPARRTRGGGEVSGVSVILDAESTEDFVQKYGLVSTALRTQAQVLDALQAAEAGNRNAQARLDAVEDGSPKSKAEAGPEGHVEADQARQAAADAKATLDSLVAEQQAQQASLESRSPRSPPRSRRWMPRPRPSRTSAPRSRRSAPATPPPGKPQPAPGPVGGGLFSNPTSISPIYVTSEYGMRLHPTLGYVRLHAGIDLRTYCNTKVYAGRAGTVTWAKTLRLRQPGDDQQLSSSTATRCRRRPTLTSFAVATGQRVERGQVSSATSGNTGTSAACHLRFEVYVNGSTTNPRPLLGLLRRQALALRPRRWSTQGRQVGCCGTAERRGGPASSLPNDGRRPGRGQGDRAQARGREPQGPARLHHRGRVRGRRRLTGTGQGAPRRTRLARRRLVRGRGREAYLHGVHIPSTRRAPGPTTRRAASAGSPAARRSTGSSPARARRTTRSCRSRSTSSTAARRSRSRSRARGKKDWDKRQALRERQDNMEAQRAVQEAPRPLRLWAFSPVRTSRSPCGRTSATTIGA